jgi:UDP-2,3-diacylglucosamine hydrolase
VYLGDDKEWLVLHAKQVLRNQHFDYFVFGHRHVDKIVELSPTSQLFYLGDWISRFSYAVWDGRNLTLEYFKYNNTQKQVQ